MTLSIAAKRARLLTIRDLIDAGGGGAAHLHALPKAANPETAAASAPLAIVAFGSPSFVLDEGGAVSMALVEVAGYASIAGVVGWVRFVDGSGTVIDDEEAGPPGSGKPVIVSDGQDPPTAQVYIGGVVTVTGTFGN